MGSITNAERATREALLAKGLKLCIRCQTVKALEEFSRYSASRDGRQVECKACFHVRYAANAEKYAERQRMTVYKRRFGISYDQFQALVTRQDGRCAICLKKPEGKRKALHVDHCHDKLHVRGLLCARCNLMLGTMEDDPALLRAAADYLERGPAEL
jgi:hypothetical protein